jgi:hypothetical protein
VRISRRDWLRATGAAGLMFPFLRPGLAAAAPGTRLILLMQSNGTNQPNFWPTTPGSLSSPILDPLVSDPVLAAKTTVIKGLRNEAGGSGNGHDQGFIGLYSGYRGVGSFDDPWGPGVSLDQQLRTRLDLREPFPTLNCAVLATDTPVFKSHRRSFSYTAPRQQVPTEVDPYKLYARFFALGAPVPAGADAVALAKQRLARKQSVLDYVTGDLAALRGQVGAVDRGKLDAHEEALRELERRLAATLTPDPDRPARCGLVSGPAPGLDVAREDDVPALIEVMFGFLALALSCQLTRIVTFQFGNGGEKWYYRWLGINENSHDDIAHRDNGTNPLITAKVLKINAWYAQQVARLARNLDQIPEAGGTVLDNSLVVWGNELATGPHGLIDIPIVLLGKAGGRLKQAGVLVDQGPQDYHRLGTSLLQIMGVPAQGFGEVPDCGGVVGLSV